MNSSAFRSAILKCFLAMTSLRTLICRFKGQTGAQYKLIYRNVFIAMPQGNLNVDILEVSAFLHFLFDLYFLKLTKIIIPICGQN